MQRPDWKTPGETGHYGLFSSGIRMLFGVFSIGIRIQHCIGFLARGKTKVLPFLQGQANIPHAAHNMHAIAVNSVQRLRGHGLLAAFLPPHLPPPARRLIIAGEGFRCSSKDSHTLNLPKISGGRGIQECPSPSTTHQRRLPALDPEDHGQPPIAHVNPHQPNSNMACPRSLAPSRCHRAASRALTGRSGTAAGGGCTGTG
jgi:hypothetical protein